MGSSRSLRGGGGGANIVANKFNRSGGGSSNGKAMLSSIFQLVLFGVVGWAFYGSSNGNQTDPSTIVEASGKTYAVGEVMPAELTTTLTDMTNSTLRSGLKFKNRAGEDIEWTFWDAFYFSMEIVTTVGYGDIVPGNDAAKIFTIFFTIVGIVVVSAAIGTIANAFLEKQREIAKAAQRKMLDQASQIASSGDDNENEREASDDAGPAKEDQEEEEPNKDVAKTAKAPNEQKGEEPKKDDGTTASQTDSQAPPRMIVPLKLPALESPPKNPVIDKDLTVKSSKPIELQKASKPSAEAPASVPPMLKDTVEIPVKQTKTKRMMDKSKMYAQKGVVAMKCCIPLYIYVALCFILGDIEGWSGVDSIYYAIITLTTVGFGDVTPVTQDGRVFASFLLPIGLIFFTIVLGLVAEEVPKVGKPSRKTLKQLLADLQAVIEADDDGTVSEEEYIIFCLKQQGKVDDDTLDILSKQFNALDADGSGELDNEDVIMLQQRCEELHIDE